MTIITKQLPKSSDNTPAQKMGTSTYQAVAAAMGTIRQYQDVPQRFQRQWITAFLALMVAVSSVSGLYLNVASRTAITGREIQHLQRVITDNQRINADYQTQIALQLSNESLDTRASTAGYTALTSENIEYISVPGYVRHAGLTLAAQVLPEDDSVSSPEYNESLIGWISRQVESASRPLGQDQ